jgi:hypothetical protein
MRTLNTCPPQRNTERTVTCTSCDTPAQVPAAVFFAALDHLGWEIFEVGGRDFYLCKLCRAGACHPLKPPTDVRNPQGNPTVSCDEKRNRQA